MALPSYDKTKRRKAFTQLPKGAYVIRIVGAKEIEKDEGEKHKHYISIIFDIAEGEYAGIYKKMFEASTDPDKKWPNDGTFNLNVPDDGTPDFFLVNYNTFFGDLEDSNGGFVFSGDVKALKGKLIGGKFHIEQTEYNGRIYDHTRLKWTCVADDVRKGNAGALPQDKLIGAASGTGRKGGTSSGSSDFVEIPDDAEEEYPF